MNAVRGWCPGALRPMMTGDGLIVRLRVTGGILQPDQAQEIARLARDCGNGLLDLSSRANLQIRGIRPETLKDLQAGLAELGLVDDDPVAEAVRNVIASPLAGIDSTALIDITKLVVAVEGRLASDDALHDLPGKLGFCVDDGGRHSLRDVAADIGFEALPGDMPSFGIFLAGTPATSCAPEQLVDVAGALAGAFLSLHPSPLTFPALSGRAPPSPSRGEEMSTTNSPSPLEEEGGPRHLGGGRVRGRMRDLVAKLGAEAIVRQAGLRFQPFEKRPRSGPVLGFAQGCLGVGATFGRLTAESLTLLADLAPGDLRLSPFRAIFLTGVDPADLAATRAALRKADFLLEDADPLRAVAACPGTPACANATTDVHRDATRLARIATGTGIALHVSGCAKGCAHPGTAPMTLVGRNGRYDLVLNGTANSAPTAEALDIAQIEALNAREFA